MAKDPGGEYRDAWFELTKQSGPKWPKPTSDKPTQEDMQEWMTYDGGCESTDGCWVEPDGICEHGHPSWLIRFGLI